MYDYNKNVASGRIVPKKIDRSRYLKSAITIQRAWRRYAARKATKKRIARLEEALGMTIPSWRSRKTIVTDEENFQRRRALMPVFEAHTKKAISDERTRVNFPTKISNKKKEKRKNKEKISFEKEEEKMRIILNN